jgi:hypothetical protein
VESQPENRGLAERVEQAAGGPRQAFEPRFHETSKDVLEALARNPNLEERDLLRLLERRDLPTEVIREIARRPEAESRYAVRLELARHPKTPRVVSLPLLKFLYLFDLLKVAQAPAAPADVRMAAEQIILKKMEALPRGEKITLARRAPGRVAAEILFTTDAELARAALDNPFLTEANLMRALAREKLPAAAVEMIARDRKWSTRYHLRLAMIRNPRTPFSVVLAWLPNLAVNDLREICLDRRMPGQLRHYILTHCEGRTNPRRAEAIKKD